MGDVAPWLPLILVHALGQRQPKGHHDLRRGSDDLRPTHLRGHRSENAEHVLRRRTLVQRICHLPHVRGGWCIEGYQRGDLHEPERAAVEPRLLARFLTYLEGLSERLDVARREPGQRVVSLLSNR